MAKEKKWLITKDSRDVLVERFKKMKRKIVLEVFTKKGENDSYNNFTINFTKEFAMLTDKIETRLTKIGNEKSKKYNVTRSPTVLIDPENYKIRYTGAPAGEEGRSFIETLLMVSKDDSGLTEPSRMRLIDLNEERRIQVFVTLTCPYCPMEVINANRAAVERPDIISSECVESSENLDLARLFDVGSVPQTIINDVVINIGLQQEETFVEGVLTLQPQLIEPEPPAGEEVLGDVDLLIIGGGPAGLTAGIYAERSGLSTVILEKDTLGGQVLITPIVENYPGFENIPGKKLMDIIGNQARNYAHVNEGEEVKEIKVGKKIEAITHRGKYLGKALLIATGAIHRKLDVPGEAKFFGKGVSYCATCDGYFYKDKNVIMVGGGNSALTDALYLDSIGAKVTVVHRRDAFRAEKRLQDSLSDRGVPIVWNSVIEKILGNERATAVKIKNLKEKTVIEMPIDAVFIAIGEIPNSELGREIGIEIDDMGFIKTDMTQRTNIPRIYAAGDVTGGVRQIVTAVSEGATATLSAFEDLTNPYWRKK